MDLGLKDRVALVAASSQGLGKAVALGLAREGCKLALCARTAGPLMAATEEIGVATNVEILATTLDVTKEKDVQEFIAKVNERFGKIDICVTNAGGPPAKPFDATTMDDWRRAV